MTKKKTPKKLPKGRKGAWFVKLRGSYIPCSWQGWLTYIPYVTLVVLGFYPLAINVQTMVQIEDMSLSFKLTSLLWALIWVLPFEVALVAIMHWFAKQRS